jgi:hypothetical protein
VCVCVCGKRSVSALRARKIEIRSDGLPPALQLQPRIAT